MTPQEQVHCFEKSAHTIAQKIANASIDATFVLGSGFKPFAQQVQNPICIPYQDIPFLPQSNVEGHGHELIFGQIQDKNVLVFTGRFHYYQGYDIASVACPAWISHFLGVPRYILTNAAGGVNQSFNVGDLALIEDHLNLTGLHPIRGVQLKGWTNPFFDTSKLYNPELRSSLIQCADQLSISLQKATYAFLTGPNFETPAEIQMLRTLGADLVGMSSVPEALVAHKCGLQTLGLSIVTNTYPALGKQGTEVSHQEVLQATKKASDRFSTLIKEWIQTW